MGRYDNENVIISEARSVPPRKLASLQKVHLKGNSIAQ